LKKWVTEFFEDFTENDSLLHRLKTFLDDTVLKENPSIGKKISDLIDRRNEQVNSLVASSSGVSRTQASRKTSSHNLIQQTQRPSSAHIKRNKRVSSTKKVIGSTVRDLLDIGPQELACQLTVRDSALYCSIQPWECVTPSAWKSTETNISLLVKHFNRIGLLLTASILTSEKLEGRVRAMSTWIRVAIHCLELNNYNGAMEVYAGRVK
jgi:hypothetical protein